MATVEVSAPSRLHFGMFSFGHAKSRQFGGVGVMVNRPGIRLCVTDASAFSVSGPLADRVWRAVSRLCETRGWRNPPACHVEVIDSPSEHQGLGTGTQCDLAAVAGIHTWLGGAPLTPVELAAAAGRGERSAVGTYGFVHGGLIVERGKLQDELLSPLQCRVELPESWRWALVFPDSPRGLAGEAERQAFCRLPAVSPQTTAALHHEVDRHLLPSAIAGDFNAFSHSLFRFGRLAGECFAASQGGAFANGRVAQLVAIIREFGVAGVGQSSWGPVVFAVLENDQAASRFGEQLSQRLNAAESLLITTANLHGATICTVNSR